MYAWASADPAWAARRRINCFSPSIRWGIPPGFNFTGVQKVLADPRLAQCLKFTSNKDYKGGGYWLHSLGKKALLPISYFEEHPEYFGMNAKGERDKEITPCLTNPDILAIIVANAKIRLRGTPGANIVSISQSDRPSDDYCHCPTCKAQWERFSYEVT